MDKVRHHQSHKGAAPGYQAASHEVRPVMQLFCFLQYPPLGLTSDIGVVSESFGDRDSRNAKSLCDILHSHRHGS